MSSTSTSSVEVEDIEGSSGASPFSPPPAEVLHQLATFREVYDNGLLQESARILASIPSPYASHPSILSDYAAVLQQLGNFSEAEKLFRRALETSSANFNLGTRQTEGGSHSVMFDRGNVMSNLGVTLLGMNEVEEAEIWLRAALAEEAPGGGESATLFNLANLLRDTNRLEDAVTLLEERMTSGRPSEKSLRKGEEESIAAATLLSLIDLRPHRKHVIDRAHGYTLHEIGWSLWEEATWYRERYLNSANSLIIWLGWLNRSPKLQVELERLFGIEKPMTYAELHTLLPTQFMLSSQDRIGVHVIVQYYRPREESAGPREESARPREESAEGSGRQNDILFCLEKNAQNMDVASIHVLVEHEDDLKSPGILSILTRYSSKIVPTVLGHRMTFSDAFTYSNTHLKENKLVALINSDVYFDNTLSRLTQVQISDPRNDFMESRVFALARWEEHVFTPRIDSQDAWIYRTPLPEKIILESKFALGLPRCDNRIAAILEDHGYVVEGASLAIHLHHVDSNMHVRDSANRAGSSGGYTAEGQVPGRTANILISDRWLF